MRAAPFVGFSYWNGFFHDCKCSVYRWRKETSTKPTLPLDCLWLTLLAVKTYNMNSKLPTQTHQLHHLASTFVLIPLRHIENTAVLLKLSNVIPLRSSSLQSPKFNIDKPTQWLGQRGPSTFDLRAILQKRGYFRATSNKMI